MLDWEVTEEEVLSPQEASKSCLLQARPLSDDQHGNLYRRQNR
jgi:hypothetical protein